MRQMLLLLLLLHQSRTVFMEETHVCVSCFSFCDSSRSEPERSLSVALGSSLICGADGFVVIQRVAVKGVDRGGTRAVGFGR